MNEKERAKRVEEMRRRYPHSELRGDYRALFLWVAENELGCELRQRDVDPLRIRSELSQSTIFLGSRATLKNTLKPKVKVIGRSTRSMANMDFD
jgi:hypothetical protein